MTSSKSMKKKVDEVPSIMFKGHCSSLVSSGGEGEEKSENLSTDDLMNWMSV